MKIAGWKLDRPTGKAKPRIRSMDRLRPFPGSHSIYVEATNSGWALFLWVNFSLPESVYSGRGRSGDSRLAQLASVRIVKAQRLSPRRADSFNSTVTGWPSTVLKACRIAPTEQWQAAAGTRPLAMSGQAQSLLGV